MTPDTRPTLFAALTVFLFLTTGLAGIAPAASADDAGSDLVDTPVLGDDAQEDASELLSNTGIHFEPNLGQFPDHVRYVVRGAGMHAFLTDQGVTFVLSEPVETEENETTEPPMDRFEQESEERREYALMLGYVDADPTPAASGQDALPGVSNHFKGNDSTKWVTQVPHYERVTQHDVWPGIDLEWYGQEGKGLKFDAIVSAGADPGQVQFTVDGAEDVSVDEEGRLVMQTPLGDLVKDVPYTYQETGGGGVEDVDTHYDLAGGVVAFAIDDYDESKKLVIDPLVYSTYLGGSIDDYGYGIAVDSSDNAIVTGYTYTNYPTTPGAYQSNNAGGYDVFVTKLSEDGGSLVYSTYLGGSDTDRGRGVAVDSNGNAIVTGETWSWDYPTTWGAYQTNKANRNDVFVTKLTSGGSLAYSTLLGGSSYDFGYGVGVDSNGNAYVTGVTFSTNYPTTWGAYQSSHAGGTRDVFVTKLSANGGSLDYSTYLGGGIADYGYGVAVDSNDNAIVTGHTRSWDYPITSGAHQSSHAGGTFDAFVTKLSANGGSLDYSTYLGGSSDDSAYGVAVDSNGNAYVTGQTSSTNYPTTSGAIQSSKSGGYDVFVTKLTANGGSLDYSTYLGGSIADYGYGVAVDSNGNAIVTGETESTNYPTTSAAYQSSHAGGTFDAFVTKLSATGDSLIYSTYLGGGSDDGGRSIAVDSSDNAISGVPIIDAEVGTPSGNAYVTGYTRGGNDVFVTKLCTTPPTTRVIESSTHPVADRFYSATTFEVAWDAGCTSYRYEFRSSACPSTLTTPATTSTSALFSDLGPFQEYWFCVQAKDAAGNWGPVASHPFGVDVVAPEFEGSTERPLDGETTTNLFESIRINYDDTDNDEDTTIPRKTPVDASEVKFFVDGIDMRLAWESQCGPLRVLYSQSCRLEVTDKELVFEPPTPWSEGQHVVEVWIQDAVEGANTEYTTWRFNVDPTPVNALPQEAREGVCGLDRDLGKELGCPLLSTDSVRLPPNWLDSLESVHVSGTAAASGSNHDWDQDGIPDLLDPVNLPSEAQWHLASSDVVDVLQGLESSGFLLLVEPGHREAFALVTNATAGVETTTDSADLLARVEATYGVETRNALARVLHADTTVHLRSVLANTPVEDVPLPWGGGSLPGDGSWLLVRSDATRSVELELGGSLVQVAAPLSSHPSEATANLRYEFLNPHVEESICYDAATSTGASACRGNSEPGWIRAYSGQAAYALEALEAALWQGLVPLQPTVTPQNPTQDGLPGPGSVPTVHPGDGEDRYVHGQVLGTYYCVNNAGTFEDPNPGAGVGGSDEQACDNEGLLGPDDGAESVDGAVDTFTFNTGFILAPRSVSIVLTAPDGQRMVFTQDAVSDSLDSILNGAPPQVWRLDGTRVSGPDVWVADGNLDGVPADGTWQWSIAAPNYYASRDMFYYPDITLSVAGKTIRAGYDGIAPTFNNPQIWNWHVTPDGATFQDDAPPLGAEDSIKSDENVQPDEDPDHARYYDERQIVTDLYNEARANAGDGKDDYVHGHVSGTHYCVSNEGFMTKPNPGAGAGESREEACNNEGIREETNTAAVFVDGSVDTFAFASGPSCSDSPSVDIVLTAPNGASMIFTRLCNSNSFDPQVWRLDGTRVSGPETWIASGDLDGAPADGTWQWSIAAPSMLYNSRGGDEFWDENPDITLSVAGKTIRAGYYGLAPAFNNPQLWNWHVTPGGATFQDDAPALVPGVDGNIQPDEDPDHARYYDERRLQEHSPLVATHDVVEPWPLLTPLVSLLDWLGDGEDAQEPVEPSVDDLPGERVSPREALSVFRLPERSLPTVFDEDAPWQILGDASREFPDGVGVDYLFELEGLDPGQSLITQARSLQDASEPDEPRAFHFQGSYTRIPARPMDLTSLRFGVEAIDGDHSGQAFLLDGRALAELLPLDGFDPVVEIDEGHEEGFDYTVRDVDDDGYDDVVVWVPHFSTATFEVTSADADSTAKFWDIEVTGEDKAWITDHSKNAVWRYKVGSNGPYLDKEAISGFGLDSSQGTRGLHAISDSEFWVGGEGTYDDNNPKSAYIAHFKDGSFVSRYWISDHTATVQDLWVNDAGTQGYAGGTQMGWYAFQSGSWVQSNALDSNCAVRDIKFDSTGKGYVGLTNDCSDFRDQDILYFDGSSFQNADGVTKETDIDEIGPGWEWAVGDDWVDASGEKKAGVYRRDASTAGSLFQAYSDSNLLVDDYTSLAVQPVAGTLWMAGDSGPYIDSMIYTWGGSQWETFQHSDTRIHDMEFGTQRFGLAMGRTEILVYAENEPPVINSASLSDTTPITQQQVSASVSAYDSDGDSLSYQWSWGDGSVRPFSTTSSASHAYDDVGSFTVRLTVSDGEDQTTWSRSVTVSPESISLGQSKGIHLTSGERHHYRVTDAAGELVEVKLSSCSGGKLLSRLDSPVSSSQSTPFWPTQPQSSTWLAGSVPSGKTLYLAVDRFSGSGTCTVTVKEIGGPLIPTIHALPSAVPTDTQVALDVSAVHAADYDTRIHVDWGDGSTEWVPASGYDASGTIHSVSHAYAARGTPRVTVYAEDPFGETSDTTFQSVMVRDPAESVVDSATSIGFYDADLSGTVTDRGGAECLETKARYQVFLGADASGSPVKSSSWDTGVCSTVDAWTVSGLMSGTLYSYRLQVDNGAWTSTSDPVSFQTLPTTSTTPTITVPATVTAGSPASFSFHHDPVESYDVRYHIDWGDGTTQTHPSSGYASPSSPVSVSHTYDFPYGTIPVSVQVEITSGSRSSTTLDSVNVGGGALVDSISHVPKASSATLTATLSDAVVQDGATEARIQYFDASQNDWVSGPWTTVSDGSTFSWTHTGLNVETVYEAGVEFQANGGASSWTSPSLWSFQSNKRPSLTALETGARDASYLDDVRFSVLYQDREGDAPAAINVTLNGEAYAMHASFGDSLDHASGVTYHYVARDGELPAPGSYWPTYQAEDAYQGAQGVQGGRVTVKQASVATHTFEEDTLGGTPQGFTKSSESLNYWRTADTDEPGFPGLAALGGHGKAAWFGHPPGANYEDPDGGVPRGSLYTRTYDLSTLQDPVLSFSSYYETEDLETTRDTKQVFVRSKDPQSTSWDRPNGEEWQPLHTIQGFEGGYKKWRSQAIDLATYRDKVVQLEFRFDAKDNQRNDYLGWLIDDIAIGHDHDGDTLPDELERNRGIVMLRDEVGPATISPGETGYLRIPRVLLLGVERANVDALLSSEGEVAATVSLGASPSYLLDAEIESLPWSSSVLGSVSPTSSSVAICSTTVAVTTPVQPWNAFLLPSPFVSYAGYSNLDPDLPGSYTTSIPKWEKEEPEDGNLRMRIDATSCLDQGEGGSGALLGEGLERDLFLRVHNPLGAEPVTVEHFRLTTVGRSSAFDADSDSDEVPDNIEASPPEILSPDHDRDTIPAGVDQDDSYPDTIPAVEILLHKEPDEITFRLHSPTPLIWEKFQIERGDPPEWDRTVGPGWVEWKGTFTGEAKQATWMEPSWVDDRGGRFSIRIGRDDAFGEYHVTFTKWKYELGQYQVDGSWGADLEHTDETVVFITSIAATMLGGKIINTATKALGWAAPARWGANAAGEGIVDAAILAGARGSIRSQTVHESPAITRVDRDWVNPHGVTFPELSVEADRLMSGNWFPGLSAQEVLDAMEDAGGPYASLQDSHRWISPRGSDSVVLVSTPFGRVLKGAVWDEMSKSEVLGGNPGSHDSGEVTAAMELLARQEIYGSIGDRSDLVCFRVCGSVGNTASNSMHLDSSKEDGMSDLQVALPRAWMDAMRQWDERGVTQYGEPLVTQNALGLRTLWEAKEFARVAQEKSDLPDEWIDYWGNPKDDPGCQSSLPQRRCIGLSIEQSLSGLDAEANGFEPFVVKWTKGSTTVATDWVGVNGFYTFFWGVDPSDQGKSVVQIVREHTLDALDGVSGSPNAVVAISIDTTGPNLGEDASVPWRNPTYQHHYET